MCPDREIHSGSKAAVYAMDSCGCEQSRPRQRRKEKMRRPVPQRTLGFHIRRSDASLEALLVLLEEAFQLIEAFSLVREPPSHLVRYLHTGASFLGARNPARQSSRSPCGAITRTRFPLQIVNPSQGRLEMRQTLQLDHAPSPQNIAGARRGLRTTSAGSTRLVPEVQ